MLHIVVYRSKRAFANQPRFNCEESQKATYTLWRIRYTVKVVVQYYQLVITVWLVEAGTSVLYTVWRSQCDVRDYVIASFFNSITSFRYYGIFGRCVYVCVCGWRCWPLILQSWYPWFQFYSHNRGLTHFSRSTVFAYLVTWQVHGFVSFREGYTVTIWHLKSRVKAHEY